MWFSIKSALLWNFQYLLVLRTYTYKCNTALNIHISKIIFRKIRENTSNIFFSKNSWKRANSALSEYYKNLSNWSKSILQKVSVEKIRQIEASQSIVEFHQNRSWKDNLDSISMMESSEIKNCGHCNNPGAVKKCCKSHTRLELVSKELNPLVAILHVYAGDLNFMK